MKVSKEELIKALNTPNYPAAQLYQDAVTYFKDPDVAPFFVNPAVRELRSNNRASMHFAQDYFIRNNMSMVLGTLVATTQTQATRFLSTVWSRTQLGDVVTQVLRSGKLLKEPTMLPVEEPVDTDNRGPSHMEKMRLAKAAKKQEQEQQELERLRQEQNALKYTAKPREVQQVKPVMTPAQIEAEKERIDKLRNLYN